jgi:hypothetical protein
MRALPASTCLAPVRPVRCRSMWRRCILDENADSFLATNDPLLSSIHMLETLAFAKHDLAGPRKLQHSLTMKLRKRSGNCFESKTEIIAYIPPAHWERHHPRASKATVHLKKESGYAFHRVLSSEQKHAVFSVPKVGRRHRPKASGNLNIDNRCLFEPATCHQTNRRINDGFCRQTMDRT